MLIVGALLCVYGPSARGGAILYLDGSPSPDAANAAATNLGHTVTQVSGDTGFINQLTANTFDLVIVDAPHFTLSAASDAALANYIAANGKAIFYAFNPSASIQTTFEVSEVSTFNVPLPISVWDTGHPVFSTPNAITGLSVAQDGSGVNGQRINPTGSAIALAGFTAGPTLNEAAMVLGNSGRTIFNSFSTEDITFSEMTAMYENQITYLLAPSAVPEPSSIILLGLGAIGSFGYSRRKRRQTS